MSIRALLWGEGEIFAFLEKEFPQAFSGGQQFNIEVLEPGRIRVVKPVSQGDLRPGGTVSGPAMMALVDLAVYMLLLAHHGAAARLSVTTGMQLSFLRKPEAGDLACDVEWLKHGRTLSVADCRLTSLSSGKLVAHAEATYYMDQAMAGA